jgi:serine/threonine-protein kinase RsbT
VTVAVESTSRREMRIECEDDVILVRRAVRALAEAKGFDAFAVAALTTATSELTRNVWVHATKGIALIEEVSEGDSVGVRVTFRDEGPGIPDIPRVLAGGYSTARSMGLGLSGSRRLVDSFELSSTVGQGTTVEILKWKKM